MNHVRAARPAPAAVGVLLVVLLAGCDVPGFGPGSAAMPSPSPGSTDSWIVVAGGTPAPSPSPAVGRPVASPSPTPMRPAAVAPAAEPEPACTGTSQPGQLNGLTVVPGTGSATVSWYHAGDPALVGYRLAAVPQRLRAGGQAAPDWRQVPPGAPCRTVTSTIDGLTPGEPYIFWLDQVSTSHVGAGERDVSIARSGVITIG